MVSFLIITALVVLAAAAAYFASQPPPVRAPLHKTGAPSVREQIQSVKANPEVAGGRNGSEKKMLRSNNWKTVQFQGGKMKQIIVEIKAPNWQHSRFGNLMLPYEKYHSILSNPTSTGFVKMSGEPTPILLLRADGYIQQFKSATLRIAFTFFKTNRGGVFAVFAEPSATNGNTSSGHLEMVYGLDVEETVSRIRSGWNSGALELVLAGKGDMEMVVSGAGKLTMPHAEWDASISLDASCVDALNAAFDDLRAFHFNFSSDDRQFNAAAQLLWDALPLEKSPILT